MVEEERVCCMCGDVGFPDKLFHCSRCRFRLQHSYCSNYYYGNESSTTVCDWCVSEGRNSSSSSNTSTTRHLIKIKSSSSSTSSIDNHDHDNTGERIKQHEHHNQHPMADNVSSPRGSNTSSNAARNSGIPSPRTAHRRYKLLKDVMC